MKVSPNNLTQFDTDELAAIRDRAERMCRQMAPVDLAGVPLYIVFSSEMPSEIQFDNCRGYTGRVLDMELRPVLGGRWRGRGVAMAINDCIPLRPVALADDYYVGELLSVVLHELAHVLEHPPRLSLNTSPAALTQFVDAGLESLVAFANEPLPRPSELAVPFLGHGWRFLRIAGHLAHRAWRAGFDFPDGGRPLWHHQLYDLSPLREYLRTLGSEAQRLGGRSFEEISAVPPPPRFCALWRTDFARWLVTADAAATPLIIRYRNDFFIPTTTAQEA